MQENMILLFVGAIIGLFSSLIGTWYQHRLQVKTIKAQREFDEKERLRANLAYGVDEFALRNLKGTSNLLNYGTPQTKILCRLIISAGPDKGIKYLVKKPIILIGKDPNTCDLILSDTKTLNIHLRLIIADHSVVLEDFSGESYVNSTVIGGPVSLVDGDIIELGNSKIVFRL